MAKIKEIGKVVTGKTPSTQNEDFWNGNIPFITPTDLLGIAEVKNTERHISEEGLKSIKNNSISGVSVLVGCIGSDMGNVAYTEQTCATNQQINAITDINKTINPLFIYYYLSNKKALFQQLAGKTTTPILSKSDFEEIEIPIPIKETQDNIVSILSAIDDKIANNNTVCAELEAMAKLLYDYWFVQFDFPDENGKPYKSSGGKMVWNEELKREIPNGWQVIRLGDHITSGRGISYNSSTLEGDGVPMLNLASFNVDSTYKPSGLKTYSGKYGKENVLRPYDLIMCNTQQTAIDPAKDIIGKTLLVPDIFDGDVVSSHHVTTIQTDNEAFKYYLHAESKTVWFHKYVAGFASGTNILGLDFNGVLNYKMPLPTDSLMTRYAEILYTSEARKNALIKENQELASLRDFLLPLLMNGQVVINSDK